ncbi:efflux RND transporter permease subunit [Nevskia ramosa]|uniref:efflux RND transporter permease subunit n=1 Tax=Nevskia ramosa TaxID=64002 RepID=UPI0003B43CE8|nr:efflux RND transporter permease subunit [Nevskia ramosa]
MFATILNTSLRNRVLVLALALVLVAVGLYQAGRLPVDVLPDLTRPTVAVQVEAAGLAAEDVETQVSYPLETALSGLPGITRLRSVSSAGISIVYAEFDWEADLYRSRQLVAERLDAARSQLPTGLAPRIGPPTSLMGEILLVALQGEGVSPQALRDHAEWTLRPALLAVPGVAQVLAIGGEIRQYEVQPDPQRLRQLGVTLTELETALRGHGQNLGAGLVESGGREVSLRSVSRPFDFEALNQVAIAQRGAAVIRVGQVADLAVGHRYPRGMAGANGHPAVIVAIQKQPGVDTLALTTALEARLATLDAGLPKGATRLTVFRQADFIRHSVGNVLDALRDGAVIVAIILFVFLLSGRATLIALTAIPLSVLAAILALQALGLSINTMTLGGLAIAVGELVDDAVVGVENVVRRLRAQRLTGLALVRAVGLATLEVRSGILYATLLIVLVFAPLFALGGVEGRLFAPLGIAYIAAILASLVVAITVTPVLCVLAFGDAARLPVEPRWLARLKAFYLRLLERALGRAKLMLVAVAAILVLTAVLALQLPRAFLPPFNEGTLTVNLIAAPGIALTESDRLGRIAEKQILEVPEVTAVGRRTGRAEADEHAEGVHYSELDVSLREGGRSRREIAADIRNRLSALPAAVSIGQPISHRLDHLLSGVRAPLVVKVIGDDLPTLRRLASEVQALLAKLPGLTDVLVEPQVDTPQFDVRIDARAAAEAGVAPARAQAALAVLVNGEILSQIVEGESRHALVLRLPEAGRQPEALKSLLIDGTAGPVPLSWIASLSTSAAPNQILREHLRRRVAVTAFPADHGFEQSAAEARELLAGLSLPPGYVLSLEGQAASADEATRRIGALALLSLLLMAAVLHARYGSLPLTLIILGNVPLALVGGVLALSITGTPLSIASLVGFVTLAGIAARNGILKISHYLTLARDEGEVFGTALVLRGSAERLTPVVMTALIAALSLMPLMLDGAAPGKEILHPVALVIFGGLLSSTLLDSFLTPLLFLRHGRTATEAAAVWAEP